MPAHPLQIAGVAIVGVAAVLAAIDLFSEERSSRQQQQQQHTHSFQTSSSSSFSSSNHQHSSAPLTTKSPSTRGQVEEEDIDDILNQLSVANNQNLHVEPDTEAAVRMPGSFTTNPSSSSQSSRSSPLSVATLRRQEWISRLVEMGFSQIQCIQALEFCGDFEQALEYLLQRGAEEEPKRPQPSLLDHQDESIVVGDPGVNQHHHVLGFIEQQQMLLDLQHPPLLPSPASTTPFLQNLDAQQHLEQSSDAAASLSSISVNSVPLTSHSPIPPTTAFEHNNQTKAKEFAEEEFSDVKLDTTGQGSTSSVSDCESLDGKAIVDTSLQEAAAKPDHESDDGGWDIVSEMSSSRESLS